MNNFIDLTEYDFVLNGADFPQLLEEFKRGCSVILDKESIEIEFPWAVCVDSVDDPRRVDVRLSPSSEWRSFRRPSDEVRQGVSPDSPVISSAVKILRSNKGRFVIVLDSEVFATKAFCDQWLLDADRFVAGDPTFQRFQGYRIINASQDGEILALAISRPNGQFGNNFKQLVHAIQVAKRIGVKKIYVPNLSQFEIDGGRISVEDMEFVSYGKRDDIDVQALIGTYFYKASFGELINSGSMRHQDIVDSYIRRLFVPLRLAKKYPDNCIAIHIRSNDLFNRPKPHPRYPQPPLAFYKIILSHFRQNHSDIKVSLVYQDRANPVIDALEHYLLSQRIQFSIYSSSLEEDLKILLSHETVVFGRGTFGKAVVSLSPHIKSVYYPWTDMDFKFILRARKISGYVIRENVAKYIAIGEWKNSTEQRKLMIDYPVSNLSLSGYDV